MTKIAAPMALTGLTDAQAMARKHPATFSVPSDNDLEAIGDGTLVKICRNDERFWVQVVAFTAEWLTGEVRNELGSNPDLPLGALINFRRKNVFQIIDEPIPPTEPSRQEMLDGLCPQHRAEHISGHVLSVFTDACPEVKMSYDDWMTLEHFIELGILEALGVDIRPDDDSSEPVTVQ
jgi:hypothetical protein